MTQTEVSTLKIDGFEVPYSALGEGMPILCCELPLNPFARFGPLQKKLSGQGRTYVFDLRPVVGYSDQRAPAEDLLDFCADFSLKVMDALHIEKCALIGSFMYGGVAMELARRAPQRVHSLVLLGTLGILRLPITPLLRFITLFYRLPGIPRLFRLPPFRALVEWCDHRITGPVRMYEIFYQPKKVAVGLAELYEQYKTPRHPEAARALMWTIRNLTYEKLVPSLEEVGCPTLILHGADDQWVPLRYAELLHTRLPNSTLTTIPQTRHMPEVEKVDLAYGHIESFLNKHL